MVGQLNSFRTRLLALIVGVMAGILGFVELDGQNKEFRDLELQLRDQAQRTIELQAKALRTPVWNLDGEEIDSQLKALVAAEDFAAARVLDETGEVISEVTEPAQSSGAIHRSGEFHLAHEIVDQGQQVIGQLRILVVNDRIMAQRAERITNRIQHFAIVLTIVAIVLIAAVTSVLRPMLNLSDAMEKLRDGYLEGEIPATDRRDEIGKIARTLSTIQLHMVELRNSLSKERGRPLHCRLNLSPG